MQLVRDIQFLQMAVMKTLKEVPDQAKIVAQDLYLHKQMIITGRGLSSVIAREGSLKIKEVTYI